MATLQDLQDQIANLSSILFLQQEQIENLTISLDETSDQLSDLEFQDNNFFILWAAVLVFIMQGGFAMLEAGFVRSKNSINILLKNLMAPTIGTLIWYLVGFGVFFGTSGDNGFIGTNHADYALSDIPVRDPTYSKALWFFQLTFASNAGTIASGALAERCNLGAFTIYIVWTMGWVYPIVAHWIFSPSGWLSATGGVNGNCCFISDVGFLDFAGSGAVHLLGGIGGLCGCIIIGPRLGRFDSKAPQPRGHNLLLSGLGLFLLWFGWFGFNPGSTGGVTSSAHGGALISNVAAVNTFISAALGGLTAISIGFLVLKVASLEYMINGILSGLVAITGPCAFIEPWAAVITGIVAGILYLCGEWVMNRLKLDDPLMATPVHALNGLWGVIVPGLFASKPLIREIFKRGPDVNYGLFMGGGGEQLAVQVIGAICIIAWTATLTTALWLILKLSGLLRVEETDERVGLDIGLHGVHAYHELAVMSKVIAEMAQSRQQSKLDREDA